MKTTIVSFPLKQWRLRMGYTQAQAAEALGVSLGGYRSAEYRNEDRPKHPCNKTVALLADAIEKSLPVLTIISVENKNTFELPQ